MSDWSDNAGPTPETPGGGNGAADRETAPPPARDETTPPGTTGGPDTARTHPAHDADTQRANDTEPHPAASTEAPPTGDTAAVANESAAAPHRGDAARAQSTDAATETAPGPGFSPGAAAAVDRARPSETGPAHAEPLAHTAAFDRPGGTPFLTARGLTATGRHGPIFTDINVTAELGRLVALCGDGGEGRSSLLLALTGRFPFRGGTLEVDGQTRPGQIRRRFTIAQAGPPIRLDPYATVGTCIKETTAVSKGAATRANINAWLDRLAVAVDTGDTFGFLPRIDQIRFAIACAAAARTPAIAVDDVDTGLDTHGSERVFDALRTVADAGQLVLAVCTRSDPPADTVVDLRAQPVPTPSARHGRDRNGGNR